jgi:hypothetical protein
MTMKHVFAKGAILAGVAAMGLSVAACDSKKENAAEDQAQAVRESGDARADSMEATGEAMGGAAESTLDAKADAVRDAADKKADRMEDNADKMDKSPQ